VALVRHGKWGLARDGFKELDTALATLPVELQRVALIAALRAAVETHDVTSATRLIDEIETVGVSPQWQPEMDVLVGRQDEELGHKQEALTKYRAAASSLDARAAAQGRLREVALRVAMNDMPRKDAIVALETLTAIWRGDETETEGLYLLSSLYRQDGRFREAFHTMRSAVLAHPNSDFTRKIQDEAAASFRELFLSGKGDALPPVEALGLFYDYRDLTPIGRLGDEMIRKLADRLIAVDLLDQAAELLQHQVDKRLQGAARAQVAAKLATVYLMNRKPERALAALRATRDSDVSNELRQHRLLLEARALSELGRQPLALEVVADIKTPEASRLRADVLWSAKRWRQAAEEIERLYGERWRDFNPLSESERADILRAAIGYALGDEAIGLARLREKYSAKMADGPDARAFNVVSSPIGTSGAEFQDVARRVGAADTLTAFLRVIRARYDKEEAKESAEPASPVAANAPASEPKAPPPPKGGVPLRPDPMPTGVVRRQR
jgi:tetratricopeptide (TPR) repeat protein